MAVVQHRGDGERVASAACWFSICRQPAPCIAAAAIVGVAPLLVDVRRAVPDQRRASRVDLATASQAHLPQPLASLQSPRALAGRRCFCFSITSSPGFGTPLYYYMTDKLRFSQRYIGILGAVSSAGWIAGALIYRWVLRRIDARRTLLYLSILLRHADDAASFLLLADPRSAR